MINKNDFQHCVAQYVILWYFLGLYTCVCVSGKGTYSKFSSKNSNLERIYQTRSNFTKKSLLFVHVYKWLSVITSSVGNIRVTECWRGLRIQSVAFTWRNGQNGFLKEKNLKTLMHIVYIIDVSKYHLRVMRSVTLIFKIFKINFGGHQSFLWGHWYRPCM